MLIGNVLNLFYRTENILSEIMLNFMKTKLYKTDKFVYTTFFSSVYCYEPIKCKWIKQSFGKHYFIRAYDEYLKSAYK